MKLTFYIEVDLLNFKFESKSRLKCFTSRNDDENHRIYDFLPGTGKQNLYSMCKYKRGIKTKLPCDLFLQVQLTQLNREANGYLFIDSVLSGTKELKKFF